jgi:hypothetical protein
MAQVVIQKEIKINLSLNIQELEFLRDTLCNPYQGSFENEDVSTKEKRQYLYTVFDKGVKEVVPKPL